MGGFFSRSSSKRRYPDPNMGGTHYKKKGLFGMLSGLGSSFSGSGSYKRYGGYPNQGYPNQNYGGQGYPNQNYGGQGYPNQNYGGQGYPNQQYGNQGNFQPNTPASAGQAICPKCGWECEEQSAFCPKCGAPIPAPGPEDTSGE